MRELSLNILDIANNSITANATLIEISLTYKVSMLEIRIKDNGCGMDKEFLEKVCDPFTTKRTTRKVGLGIPLFKYAAESAGGTFNITSAVGVGTEVIATFDTTNIDCMPLGDIADTMTLLITVNEKIDFVFKYTVKDRTFKLDTKEIKQVLGDISLNNYEVIQYIRDLINENIIMINGGSINENNS